MTDESDPTPPVTRKSIDLRQCFPDYAQFAAFGQPDAEADARSIKPLLDATQRTLGLLVTVVNQLATVLNPTPQSVSLYTATDATEPAPDPLAQLDSLLDQLNATYALINPTNKEPNNEQPDTTN